MGELYENRFVAEYNGRRGERPQRTVSTVALRLPVELPESDGRVPGHSGAALPAPQRPRMRGLHTLHRRGLSGSGESEFDHPLIATFWSTACFRLSELQTAREDGPGRVPFDHRRHPHTPGHGLS